jgi:hypothetical protein
MKKIISTLVILIFITGCTSQTFSSTIQPEATPISPNEGKFKIERLGSQALGWILYDLETGCQYIAQNNDVAYTPRLNAQGVPMCEDKNKK